MCEALGSDNNNNNNNNNNKNNHNNNNNFWVLKSRIMRWAGHVTRMEYSRGAYKSLVGRRDERRPLGRPTRRWEDNIKINLPQVGWEGRMDLSGSGLGKMVGSCEWGNESSVLINCGESVD